ncbi:Crp/Fnr family transcriptional regulator [Pontibacter sp. JH31]|uniref:Crp/Fnr family transcriptional regulator n=1 Tax=Pontibacter aquaedesilientis TaxID=2766980 RepID=A0ABR7XEX7_9BACT|nr:Crp/Fnr family transcriptional regulator [Pontibacter aquaedesilientis]MBD1396848.1 Crp/Fnr family transcriptional regulator [Pontibacter aquaedesilientis]
MTHTKLWHLENFSMLHILSKSEIEEMDRMAVMRNMPRNQVIYFPEDSSDTVFLLKKGKVKLSRISESGKEMILAILGPGEIFGELSITGQTKREEIAAATEDAVICSVGISDFQRMMEMNPKFNLQVTKFIGFRLKKIQSRLEGLIFKTAEQRVRYLLKELAEEHGRQIIHNPEERVVKMKLTHEDIAKLSATSRQTVTSVLNDLEKQGLISYDRSRIFIRKHSEL